MPSPARSRFLRYAAAPAAVAVATAVRWALDPYMGGRQPLTAYYFAVLVVSWFAGLGPSIVALVLSIAAAVLLVPPSGRFHPGSAPDLIWIGMFAGVCSAIVGFVEAGRRARARLEREAEERAGSRRPSAPAGSGSASWRTRCRRSSGRPCPTGRSTTSTPGSTSTPA